MVYAWFTQSLRQFTQFRFTPLFTQSLRRVYARFTQIIQSLRRVYAGLRSSGTCCLLRKPSKTFYRFTQGLRRFTHIVHKPKKVHAEFTQVYAAYVGLRRGQFADGTSARLSPSI
jgi:hypothetical protein